jgi:ABC-type iron transport system FetAB ATPase subunit
MGRRIAVVGASGNGKTTIARALAARLGAPHVELDALHHGPNWSAPSAEEFRRRVASHLEGDAWRGAFWGRESLFVWTVRTYFTRRRTLPVRFARHPHLKIVRLRSPREVERYLKNI